MLKSKRIIKVPKEFQISFYIICASHDYNYLDHKYNELSILLGKYASLHVFGTSDRQCYLITMA